MTEGGRPAHRRKGQVPTEGKPAHRGEFTEGPARKKEGRLPTEGGNLHKQGGDNPAQKAREVCKQRKRHTCQTKEMKHQHKKGRERPKQRKRNLQWRETKGKPTQGTQKTCTQKGSLELKTCKLRGEYTQTQNTRSLIDFAETEQHENHTLTPNTGREAKYLIDFAEIQQQQNHTRTQNTRWG